MGLSTAGRRNGKKRTALEVMSSEECAGVWSGVLGIASSCTPGAA